MKRYFLFVLTLLCMSVYTLSAQNGGPVYVSTGKEFVDVLRSRPNADIVLTQDIDLQFLKDDISIFGGYLIAETFTGSISGAHTAVVDGEEVTLPYAITGLPGMMFASLEGADILYVEFRECNFEVPASNYGLLACEADQCIFRNLSFTDCHLTDNAVPNSDCFYVGVLVNEATDCEFSYIYLVNTSVEMDGSQVGGFASQASFSTFISCYVNVDCAFAANGVDKSNVGSFCGMAEHCSFTDCVSLALVNGGEKGDRVGGLVGSSTDCIFRDCRFSGVALQANEDTWNSLKSVVAAFYTSSSFSFLIDGLFDYFFNTFQMGESLTGIIEAGYALSDLLPLFPVTGYLLALELIYIIYEANDPDELGGIAGYADGGYFIRCTNSGTCYCLDAYCGGIVGYAKGDSEEPVAIQDCLNEGPVMGGEQTGGIVGYVDYADLSGCLCVTTPTSVTPSTTGPIWGERGSHVNSVGHYAVGKNASASDDLSTVTGQMLASGEVGAAMNERSAVWRQAVGTDKHPMLASSKPVVTSADINPSADGRVHISDFDGLKGALVNRYADIVLDADIYVDAYAYGLCTEEYPFRGTLDGNGHCISDLCENNKMEDSKYSRIALFSYADGATFSNLNVCAFRVDGTFNIASLTAYSSGCTFSDISLTECTLNAWGDEVGGITSNSKNDTFSHCTTSSDCAIFTDGVELNPSTEGWGGGFAGTAVGSTFEYCTNNATLSANDDYLGGFVGIAENCTFNYCVNNGKITSDDSYVGGIAGAAKGSTFDHCENNGEVMANDNYVAGIVGEDKDGYIFYCTNKGYIHHESVGGWSDGDDYLGGIVASATSTYLQGCINDGKCVGADAYVGGIMGYGKTAAYITDCLNRGEIHGDDDEVGGIAGMLEKSYINTSLQTGKVYKSNDSGLVTDGWGTLYGVADDSHLDSNYILFSGTEDAGEGGRALVNLLTLASGKVCYALNRNHDGNTVIWRQRIGTDGCPVPTSTGARSIVHRTPTTDPTYFNINLNGDVNDDGSIDVSDVTLLVSVILGQTPATPWCDVNDDKSIDVSDVTSTVSIILSNDPDTD